MVIISCVSPNLSGCIFGDEERWDILIGDKKEPAKEDPSYATWDAENSMLMTWLVKSMEEDISSNYMCYPTAKELWDNVNQMYSYLGNQSQI